MTSKIEPVSPTRYHLESAAAGTTGGFFYEVSKKPQSRHKKLFSPAGTSLTTPSGARIPPAWKDVWMTTDPKSPIQSIGYDSKGRRVYLYSAEHTGRAMVAKFSRLKAFSEVYPALIKKVGEDMKTSEEALILYLISKTGFRIGSNSETQAAVKAFGASTLKCSHVSIEGNKLAFDFTGKKGIRITKVLKDPFLAQDVASRCDGDTDHKLFKTTDNEIRAYLHSIPGGSGFTIKDFRTYLGTLTAFRKIKTMPVPTNRSEFKRFRNEVGETVAKELGNSTKIALNSYVSPEVFCVWEAGPTVPVKKDKGKRSSFKHEFFECIHYDRDVPMEEYLDADPLEQLE